MEHRQLHACRHHFPELMEPDPDTGSIQPFPVLRLRGATVSKISRVISFHVFLDVSEGTGIEKVHTCTDCMQCCRHNAARRRLPRVARLCILLSWQADFGEHSSIVYCTVTVSLTEHTPGTLFVSGSVQTAGTLHTNHE